MGNRRGEDGMVEYRNGLDADKVFGIHHRTQIKKRLRADPR
jgi:hypothetical protein